MLDIRAWREAHGLDPDGGPTCTQRETAKVLHWSIPRVSRWTKAGRLPHDREHAGGWPVYPIPALDAWLNQQQGRAA